MIACNIENARLAVLGISLALLCGEPGAAMAEKATGEPSKGEAERAAIAFFETNVRPLLIEHCQECHGEDEVSGGLRLDSREGWLAGGDSGPALVPNKPQQSLLIEAVRFQNPNLQMPPSGRLNDAQVAILEKWVARGAPDPRKATAAAAAAEATGMSIEEGRAFWSFQPVGNPVVPELDEAAWIRTPVDAFVLARLRAAGLQPAPRADKRTLIRRATFDLIGLPPTPQQVVDFLADKSPDAFERLVERLLSSPQYGERWGRHWLDVARYADSNGLDENLAFGNAWRYRDYVVDAFNRDKPFDRFLIEQLAGDLLPEADRETKTATGFLVLGAKVLAEPDREKLMMDTIDEQIDATGKAFLGMTLGCTRCHDHKFDPIKQQDYYALAAIFKSTKTFADSHTGAILHWHEHSFASQAELQKIAEIDAAIAAKIGAAAKFKNEAMAQVRQRAEGQAAQYLAAASRFSPSASLKDVQAIAEPLGLHPRILHHCRLHLAYNRDDPFFAKWHELVSEGQSSAAIEAHFQEIFQAAARSDDSSAAEESRADERQLQLARDARADPSGFLAVPPKPEFAFGPDTLAEYHRLMEEARLFESQAADEPAAMGVSDGKVLTSLPIHIRGSHHNLGQPVRREFPAVMRFASVRPVLPRDQSGRLALARWMASTQHPLTSRVYVNRVWGWHFGEGLVGTTENFGVLGDRPTHPQLLDWLARSFMESDWSTKELHRLLLSSSVYQMAASHPAEQQASRIDPENKRLWKFRRQRLEAEQIRDAILAVSGCLDQTMVGKTVPLRNRQFVFNHTSVDHTKYDSHRRALYLPVIRNNLYTFFQQFDFPDPTMPTGDRQATVVAPQALLMMNDPLVLDAATALAERVQAKHSTTEQQIEWAYQLTLSRPPSDEEIERAITFLDQTEQQIRESENVSQERTRLISFSAAATDAIPAPRLQAWTLFCQALLASNEFIYLE